MPELEKFGAGGGDIVYSNGAGDGLGFVDIDMGWGYGDGCGFDGHGYGSGDSDNAIDGGGYSSISEWEGVLC